MTEIKTIPTNDWTLEELGAFCVECRKRMASDAWATGRAMCIAKEKCQDEKKSFSEWKQRHEFSNATASRYMRLFMAFPGEDDRNRLSEIGIMEAMAEAGISKARQPAAEARHPGDDQDGSEESHDRHRPVNNDLGYFPGNVWWATASEQARNRGRSAKLVSLK